MSPWRVALASLLALSALMALAAAPASASPRHYQSQLSEANGAAFTNPFGLTVDSSNNLWVSDDHAGGTVSKFNSSGAYQAQTSSPPWSGEYIESVAFSEAAGEVFVSDSNADDLWGLEPSAAYSSTDLNSGLGGGCCYIRVAADNSGGEANGDLYVSKESSVVRIDGSGAAANFSAGSDSGTNELTGPFSSAGALAVAPNGDLYVASGNKVYVFEPSGELAGEITEFEGAALGSITAIAIDPSNEDVLLAESGAIKELSSSGESLAKITEAHGAAFGSIQGLAVDSTGTLYAADGIKHVVDVFGHVPAPPRPDKPQLSEANGAAFTNPFGLTVDSSNNLWVSDDHAGGTVSKFNSSGAYQAQTSSPPWSGEYIESVAFSEAAGEVFVSDSNADDLWGLEPSAAYSSTDLNSGLGGGCCYIRVAADNSGGEANGDLYVSKESSVVRIDGSGAAANFSAGSDSGTNELTGPFSSAGALAVAPNGDLYVASGNKVYVFEPSGELAGEITEFEGAALGSITAIAIDPSNEDVLLAESGAIKELSSSGESLAKITEAHGAAFGSIQGLAVDSTGTLYAADGIKHVVDVFGHVPAPPRPDKPQLSEANGAAFTNPFGLTVDSSNNLWVSDDHAGGTVSKFNSSGAYQAQTSSPPWSGEYIESVAFSEAAGEVFVSDSNADDLWGLEPSAAYSSTDLNSGLGGGCCYIRVAADNSGGEANGDLYVSKESSVVRIDGSGAAANFSAGSDSGTNELTGPFSSAGALAVAPNGDLYVASGNKVYVFEPSGELAGEITEFEGAALGSITAIAIDPSNEDVLLAESGAIKELSSSGESLAKITEAHGAAFGSIQGLAVDSTGTLYAADGIKHVVDVFGAVSSGTESKLPLEVTVTGNGSVSSSPPGISCGSGTCTHEFKEGKTVTLTAHPAPNNHFVEWSGLDAGSCASATAPSCEVSMSAARSLSGEFAPTFHTLAATPTGPGSVSANEGAINGCEEGGGSCSGPYQEGSTVLLTATPATHYHLTWSGCSAEPSADECEVEIGSSDGSVQAAFSINTHSLTVDHSGLGSVSANEGAISDCSAAAGTCTGVYDEASTIVLTAAPAAHKHAVWEGGCSAEPSADECEVEIGPSDQSVEVAFPPNKHQVTVTPSGEGTVRANSGTISHCTSSGGSCAGEYLEAATVTLIATPGAHQAVAWTGCTRESGDSCEVTVGPVDAGVGATFSQITHTLTIAKSGSGEGSFSCDGGACAPSYDEGTVLTLTATPDSGSTFTGWSGAGCSGTGTCQVTIEADTSLSAGFDAKPPPPPPAEEQECVVPRLAGETLRRARGMLGAANCSLGKVTKPRARKGHRLGRLVVRSSSPKAGTTLPTGAEVNLRLAAKHKHKKKGRK